MTPATRRSGPARRRAYSVAIVAIAWLLSACRTPPPDPREIHVCLVVEQDVRRSEVAEVVAWMRAEGRRLGLDVRVPAMRLGGIALALHRPTLDDLLARPLVPPCDRLLAVLRPPVAAESWDARAISLGTAGIDRATRTRGFVVVPRRGFPQSLVAAPLPAAMGFDLLVGCAGSRTAEECAARVARLRRARPIDGFFPTTTERGDLLATRDAVQAEIAARYGTPGAPSREAGDSAMRIAMRTRSAIVRQDSFSITRAL